MTEHGIDGEKRVSIFNIESGAAKLEYLVTLAKDYTVSCSFITTDKGEVKPYIYNNTVDNKVIWYNTTNQKVEMYRTGFAVDEYQHESVTGKCGETAHFDENGLLTSYKEGENWHNNGKGRNEANCAKQIEFEYKGSDYSAYYMEGIKESSDKQGNVENSENTVDKKLVIISGKPDEYVENYKNTQKMTSDENGSINVQETHDKGLVMIMQDGMWKKHNEL